VYAVEIDSGFFPYIRQKAAAAGVTNVQTVLGAYSDPKLPTRDVDLAFMHDVLHHVQDRAAYFTNLVKYLKPDARIAIVDYIPAQSPHKDDPSLQVSKADAARWLSDVGFTRAEEIPLAPDKWFVIYSRP
jgi:cyclopropane fatty-acyl-phospholipid synthase-like methyltransferase